MSEQTYTITPFGLLGNHIPDSHARTAIEALELYCRRHGMGLAIDPQDNRFRFVAMAPAEATQTDPLQGHPELQLEP